MSLKKDTAGPDPSRYLIKQQISCDSEKEGGRYVRIK